MLMNLIEESLKWAVLGTGILDAFKYKFLSQKIARLKSSREISRKFINISLLKNFVLLLWAYFFLKDWAVTWSCVISLYTGWEAFLTIYEHYPYQMRGCNNFKRPSLWKYTLNSIIPNTKRKRL